MEINKVNYEIYQKYLESRDNDYLIEIMNNINDLVTKATKSVLKKYGADENLYEEYLSVAYISVSEKLEAAKYIPKDSKDFYRLIFRSAISGVKKCLDKEAEDKYMNIQMSSFRDNLDELEMHGLVDYCIEELEFDMDLDKFRKLNILDTVGLTENQRKCIEQYFGFSGERLSADEIAKKEGFSRIYVHQAIGRGLIRIRKDIFENKNKYAFLKRLNDNSINTRKK